MSSRKDSIEKVLFWGATGQAKVLRDCIQHIGLELVAIFDNNSTVPSPFSDVPIYYGQEGFQRWWNQCTLQEEVGCLVAIGGENGLDRLQIQEYLKTAGLKPLTVKHPTAFVAENATIGEGCQILAHTTIGVEVQLGQGCLVNTAALIDHECQLGEGVHIGPGAKLAGYVTVEAYATLYTGAVVVPRIRIGTHSIVGAGAVVLKDVPAGVVVAGNPARVIRERS